MFKIVVIVNFLLIFSHSVLAQEVTQVPTQIPVDIKWRGFVNLIVLQDFSDHNLLQLDHETNFTRFSAVGLQANAQLAPDMQFVTQVIGKGTNNFEATFDWMLLRYSPTDKTNIFLGKQKYPIWMVSDRLDVGYTYPWLVPPIAVYGAEPFRNFTGLLIESSLYRSTDSLREIILEVYGGNAALNRESQANNLGISNIEYSGGLSHLRGVNLIYRDETLTFRLAYSALQSNIDLMITATSGTVFLPGLPIPLTGVQSGQLALHGDYELYSAGLELNSAQYLLMSEYARTRFDWDNDFGFQADPTEAYYITVGQKFEKLTPFYSFSKHQTKSHSRRYDIQTLGSTYTLNDHTKFKVELKRSHVQKGTTPFATAPTEPEWAFGAGLTAVF